MTLRSISASLVLVCLPFIVSAQEKVKTRDYRGNKVKTYSVPTWGPAHRYTAEKHVYFPDYYTFYDPSRGYVYYNNGTWTTTTTVPTYMSKVDLNKARIEMLDDEITVHPETKYKVYRGMYPARKVEVVVPAPDVK